MSINPEQKPYLKLTPLRMQCLTNFPFIEADFDALTDYQLFCEIVKYLNNVIKNENIVSENVISLYDAFMQLQEEVEHELEEQNQRIDDYFENTNIQAFVDNKINEMIESDEFQALLIDAINEVNPRILDEQSRVNVFNLPKSILDYGVTEITYNTTFFDSETDNKEKLIAIINDMKSKGHKEYYFINNLDIYVPLFKLELSSNPVIMQIRPFFDFSKLYLNIGEYYTSVLNFTLTIENDIVTDISFDSETKMTFKYLKEGNENAWTPTLPYEPATKDYVDSNSGSSDFPVTVINLVFGYYANDADLNFNADLQLIGEKLKEHYETYGNNGYIYIVNPDNGQWYSNTGTLFEFKYINMNFGEMAIGKPFSTRPQKFDLYYQDVNTYVFTFTSYEPLTMFGYNGTGTMPKVLTTTNQDSYSPTQDSYEPATAKYVEYVGRSNVAELFNSATMLSTQVNFLNSFTSSDLAFIRQGDIYQIKGQFTNANLQSGGIRILEFPVKYGTMTVDIANRIGNSGTCLIYTSNSYILAPYVFLSDVHDNATWWQLYIDIPQSVSTSDVIYIDSMWIHNRSND